MMDKPQQEQHVLTLEQKITLCHRVNRAIAYGRTVQIGDAMITHGLFIRGGNIVAVIPFLDDPTDCVLLSYPVIPYIAIKDNTEVLYDPKVATQNL